jgi:hypothetical protein
MGRIAAAAGAACSETVCGASTGAIATQQGAVDSREAWRSLRIFAAAAAAFTQHGWSGAVAQWRSAAVPGAAESIGAPETTQKLLPIRNSASALVADQRRMSWVRAMTSSVSALWRTVGVRKGSTLAGDASCTYEVQREISARDTYSQSLAPELGRMAQRVSKAAL